MTGSADALGGGDKGAGDKGAGDKGAGGGDQTPFYESFKTPEVKELLKAKNYADPEALGTAYYNANKALNGAKDVITIPGDKATDEDWGKVFAALGRPETADKYDLKFKEGMTVDAPFLTFAKGLFHGMGLSPSRAQVAADKWQTYVTERTTALATEAKANADKELGTLKTTWGKDWDTHVAAGQKAVKGLGMSDAELGQLDKAMGFPAVMKLLAAVGKGIGKEDTTITDGKGGPSGMKGIDTEEQARVEITRLSGDKEFQDSMRDVKNPAKRQENLKLWEALHAAAYSPVKRA